MQDCDMLSLSLAYDAGVRATSAAMSMLGKYSFTVIGPREAAVGSGVAEPHSVADMCALTCVLANPVPLHPRSPQLMCCSPFA